MQTILKTLTNQGFTPPPGTQDNLEGNKSLLQYPRPSPLPRSRNPARRALSLFTTFLAATLLTACGGDSSSSTSSPQWEAKLPHSGITANQCYGSGSDTLAACSGSTALNGQQDGHRASINAKSYSLVPKSGGSYTKEECAKDDLTGLTWEGKTASDSRAGSNTYTNYHVSYGSTQAEMDAATNSYGYVAVVNALNLCGYSDWRLPTKDELLTLVDYGASSGARINSSWFPNTQVAAYWSSSPYVDDSGEAWPVGFDYGIVRNSNRSGSSPVRLVRGGQVASSAACPTWPTSERFILNGEEVTDKRTGLTWKRCSEGQSWDSTSSICTGTASTHTHEQALSLAKAANSSDSATGWRLPSVTELSSLADGGCKAPAIDSTAFPATPTSNYFWTSSPYVGYSDRAWYVNFSYGYVHYGSRSYLNAVRLVRASQ